MRQGVLVSAVLVLLLGGVPAQVQPAAGGGALREDVAARLAALGPDAEALRVAAHPASGAVRRLTSNVGGALPLAGENEIEKAQDFVARFGPLFDATGAVQLEAPRWRSTAP